MIYVISPLSRRSRFMMVIECDAKALPSDYRGAIIPILQEQRDAAFDLCCVWMSDLTHEDPDRREKAFLEAKRTNRRASEISELLKEFGA